MATTTTVSSNYNGTAAGAIIGQAFKTIDTIEKGAVTIAENVNFKISLRKIAYTDGTTAYTCGFAPAGTIVLNENVIEPFKFKNDFDVCKDCRNKKISDDPLCLKGSHYCKFKTDRKGHYCRFCGDSKREGMWCCEQGGCSYDVCKDCLNKK